MKAIVCHEYGPIANLAYEEIARPAASGRNVVIRAAAIGVNFPDGLLVQGLYQSKPETPFTPGLEMAGRIEEAGPDVKRLKPGMRVVAMAQTGAFAEFGLYPETACLPIPDTMSDADACALLCAYGTAHHALKQRAALKEGETLVVPGAAGATGIAAIQIGKAMGAQVIAIASTAEKQAIAHDAGADHVIGYDEARDALKSLTGKRGIDVVFDPVGGDTFDSLVRLMGRNGRYLVVGFAAGRIPQFPANLALVKEFSLVGVFWGSFTQHEPALFAENMRELFAWHAKGLVRPLIGAKLALGDAPSALQQLMDRQIAGKIILTP